MYKWMLHPLREGIGFKPLIKGKEKYEEEQEEKEKEEGRGRGKARVSSVPSGSNNEV